MTLSTLEIGVTQLHSAKITVFMLDQKPYPE